MDKPAQPIPKAQPLGDWNFTNETIAETFTEHVNSQLRWYGLATELFITYASHFLYPQALVYDFGCSTGNISLALKASNKAKQYRVINVDESLAMGRNFAGEGQFLNADLKTIQLEPYDVGFLFLTLMFLPAPEQEAFLAKAVANLKKGGVLLLLERLEPSGGYNSLILQRAVHISKIKGGFSPADAMTKDLSLVGVQRPLDPNILKDYQHEEIFRYGDFRGFAIRKS